MNKVTKRRLILGTAVIALAISPFIIRNLRKTTQLPTSTTFTISKDPSVVPSGKIDVVNDYITFVPLTLPQDNVHSGTLNSVLSNDNKWLLVSYCFGEDCQSQICYVPLDKFGLLETFVELKNFGTQSVVAELGCSSLSNQQNGRFSYRWRRLEDGVDACSESLECISLRHEGKKIECSSEPVLLDKIEFQMKQWGPFGVGGPNHCWLDGQNAFVSVRRDMQNASLTKTDCGNVDGDRFHSLRPLLQGPVGQRSISRCITSNFLLDGKTVKFLEAPSRSMDTTGQWNPAVDPYRSDPDGLLVSLNLDGTIKSEEAFPVPSHNRKVLITNTHLFVTSTDSSGQFFLTAALKTPQEYFELRFSKDEIQLPDSGINYIYTPLAILPSGKHLLCARDVGRSYVDKARELKLPLSTLGIIELPFKIG